MGVLYRKVYIFTIHLICPVLFTLREITSDVTTIPTCWWFILANILEHAGTITVAATHTQSTLCYFRYLTISPTSYSFSPSLLLPHSLCLYIISFLILLATCIHIQPYERPHSLCLYWSLWVGMSVRAAGWLDGAGACWIFPAPHFNIHTFLAHKQPMLQSFLSTTDCLF